MKNRVLEFRPSDLYETSMAFFGAVVKAGSKGQPLVPHSEPGTLKDSTAAASDDGFIVLSLD